MAFVGQLHPLLVHFPIGRVLVDAVAEVAIAISDVPQLQLRADDRTRGGDASVMRNIRWGGAMTLVAMLLIGRGTPAADRSVHESRSRRCSEFCGTGHGRMKAALISIGPTQTNR